MSFMCQYGNCQESDTPIIVSDSTGIAGTRTRERFCCLTHAALCLSDRAAKSMHRRDLQAREE